MLSTIRLKTDHAGENYKLLKCRYTKLNADSQREEEYFESYSLSKHKNYLDNSRSEAEQILNYYVLTRTTAQLLVLTQQIFHSRQNDVNYYFEKSIEQDWRVSELTPMANTNGNLGKTVVNLFAALHRLRADRGESLHFVHYHRAVRSFLALLIENKTDWLSTLACVILFAQYDVNTQKGKNLAMHLAAAANIIQTNAKKDLPSILYSRRHALIRITMVYDLQHSLISGDDLYLKQTWYERGVSRSESPQHKPNRGASIDVLWSETHLLWARFTKLTKEVEPDPAEINEVCLQLKSSLLERCGDWFVVDNKSPLHSYCPFGPTLLYRSPGLRLVSVTLYALVLMMNSWFPKNAAGLDVIGARNKILCAHAPFFDSGLKGRKGREDNKFLHQAFPAIVQIMMAASEVGEDEICGQEWISSAMHDAKMQGYSLGELLLMIIRSHSEPGKSWTNIGCRTFIESCRHLRKLGLA